MFEQLRTWLHLPEHARERLHSFSRFVWHRFVEDRCFEAAAVLAYGTVFALVPLSVAVFGIVAAFPIFERWNETLSDFLFTHFVPGAARVVEDYLLAFADSATKMTTAGLIAVLLSALFLMKSVEDMLNRIWRVSVPRPRSARFLVYWTSLTLGPLLVVASLTLSTWLFELPIFATSRLSVAAESLLRLLPFAVELGAFSLLYVMVPNHRVRIRHALIGGLLASLLFESAKSAFAWYLRQVPSYEQIYGTLAVLPIFLLWIYLSWAVLLLGASIAASLSSFRFQPASERMQPEADWLAALRLLLRFLRAQRGAYPLSLERLRELEPSIEDDTLVGLLDQLTLAGVLERNEEGDWLFARDPHETRLAEVYSALRAHAPLQIDAQAAGFVDTIGRRVLDRGLSMSVALAPLLDRPLATLENDLDEDE